MRSGRFLGALLINALIGSSLFLMPLPASAEGDNPRAEVYLGYAGIIGFNGSVAFNLNRWFGVVGDYSYRVAEYYADKPLHTFAAGPRVSLRLIPRVTPFAHALFGGAGSGCGEYSDTSGCRFGTASAVVLGGGLDVQINKDLSFRVIQIDKIRPGFGNGDKTYTGLSFGIVIRTGRVKR